MLPPCQIGIGMGCGVGTRSRLAGLAGSTLRAIRDSGVDGAAAGGRVNGREQERIRAERADVQTLRLALALALALAPSQLELGACA